MTDANVLDGPANSCCRKSAPRGAAAVRARGDKSDPIILVLSARCMNVQKVE